MDTAKQLEILYRISHALVGKQELDDILYQIVTMTGDLIDSKICALMLLNEENNTLALKTTQSLSSSYRSKPDVDLCRSISGDVIKYKTAIQVKNVSLDERYHFGDIARAEGLESLLSVPMLIGPKAIGVLICYTEKEKVFDSEEIQLVQTIANHAAMAIEHMHVIEKEKKARLSLETKKSVDQAKRILFKNKQMQEEDAHKLIQRASMENGKSLKETAEAIILAAGINLESFIEQK
ncbi:MAG: GAF domain-containing protein [Candidatus Omnitrophota bacterium]|jgi:GAF domain-containing protein